MPWRSDSEVCGERMRNNGHRMQPGIKNKFFALRVVKRESRLQRTCRISILADIESVTGQSLEQPDTTAELAPCGTRWPPLGFFY